METNGTNKQKTKAEELYDKGWNCHNHRKYECAAKYYKEAAALGSTEALYFLALLYYEGKGVNKDLAEATKCFEAVAKSGGRFSEEAKLRLERLADIDSGKGIGTVETNLNQWIYSPEEAEKYRKMWTLAEQGNLEAQRYIAGEIWFDLQENGNPDGDGETMLRYLRNLAEHGDYWAQDSLAETYFNDSIVGVGIGDLDEEEGIKLYRKFAQDGNPWAQGALAHFLYEGDHVKADKEEAFYWQMHHIETDEYLSEYDLEIIGYPYTYGDGKWYTTKEACKLFKKFAKQGDAVAQYYLTYFYLNGVCVRKNRAEAIKWLTMAAEQDFERAQFMLGELYYEGEEVEQDFEKAFKWYQKSAERGRVQSEFIVGEFYCKGIGVKQDDQEAIKWYKKVAKQMEGKEKSELHQLPKEVGLACKRLGLCYHEGKGVKQNDKVAMQWYEKAGGIFMSALPKKVPNRVLPKEVLDTAGQLCDIAESYFEGNGVDQNIEKALKWYKIAAQNGHLYSQRKLAEIYEEGVLVKQDYKEAYKWYDEMAECGDLEALYITGLYYLEGKGVKANKEEAIARIKKAASLGFKEAKTKLAELDE